MNHPDRAVLPTLERGSELAAGISLSDLRPDGSIKVMGRGARERVVLVGAAARRAIARYLDGRGPLGGDTQLLAIRPREPSSP